MRTSVIMPAFNEAANIGNTLRTLLECRRIGLDLEIVVAPNGCTDATAEVARGFDVRVVELTQPSKTGALNAAEAVATGGPRIYLDADVPIDPGLIELLVAAVSGPGVRAAVPRPEIDATASSWPVRAYYRINGRLPVFRGRLFGRGIIALSAAARSRFARFPELIADDMFLDAMVGPDEKIEVDGVIRVLAPARARDLVRRLARARAGNAEFWRIVRAAPADFPAVVDAVPGPRTSSWLRQVVLPSPRLLPAAVCYLVLTVLAEAWRRWPGWNVRSGWGRMPGPAGSMDQR